MIPHPYIIAPNVRMRKMIVRAEPRRLVVTREHQEIPVPARQVLHVASEKGL